MEIALYIAASLALVALAVFLFRMTKTVATLDTVLGEAKLLMQESKKDIGQISSDISQIKMHLLPVIDNLAEVSQRVSTIAEGLESRIDGIYDTIDDTLDVVRGALDDAERIKSNVVSSIEKPLAAIRDVGSSGTFSSVLKGINLVKELIQSFRKNGTH
jgi:hypothetical protein